MQRYLHQTKEIEENFKEIGEKFWNSEKRNQERVEKIVRNFYINFKKNLIKFYKTFTLISRKT